MGWAWGWGWCGAGSWEAMEVDLLEDDPREGLGESVVGERDAALEVEVEVEGYGARLSSRYSVKCRLEGWGGGVECEGTAR